MANVICHHEGVFNIYSTVSDGFFWESGITEDELTKWYQEEYGKNGLTRLPARLERAKQYGTSAQFPNESLDEFLCCNRAGENEARLTTQECIDKFLTIRDR